jgi:hypothetical protein
MTRAWAFTNLLAGPVPPAMRDLVEGRSTNWSPEDHPRAPDGKFGPKGDTPGGAQVRTELRQWMNSADDPLPLLGTYDPNRGDNQLLAIWDRQGFSGKPKVVSETELDQAVAGGAKELWRGITGDSAKDQVEQYRSGETPFPGLGIYGNGTYTTTHQDIAEGYAKDRGKIRIGATDQPGAVMRVALPADARTIEYDQIVQQAKMSNQDLMDLSFEAMDAGDRDAAKQAAALTEARNDPGRFASLLGYDAIVKRFPDRPDSDEEWVILNRSKLLISDRTREV